ncbi:MAG: 4-alpha-glucanotransferase, partial [Ramlibacter sp.]
MHEGQAGSVSQALAELCAHFRIDPDYHDIWGARHPVSAEGLTALLGEFGVMVHGEDAARQALDAARQAAWTQLLPPVTAISEGAADWFVALKLPASLDRIHWELQEEGGALHRGDAQVAALHESARAGTQGDDWTERQLRPGIALPPGYHRLRVQGLQHETLVICAPARCFRPAALQDGGKVWGPAVQLYALRSPQNWGMGDFSDLARLAAQLAGQGADIIGLNPLHALFPHNPAHASPYSPSSRQHLNVLYIDVEAVAEFPDCEPAQRLVRSPEFQARLAALRATEMVDYTGVAAAKFEVLELLFRYFRSSHFTADGVARTERGRDFLAFLEQRGQVLGRHALFEALQAHFHATDSAVWGWPVWPQEYRDPAGAAVADFARTHSERVCYFQYLQWLAQRQLARAAAHCKTLGMSIGLYVDLAVSVDRAGSDAWGEQATFAAGASVGAPPDEFNPAGQGWGLPPLRPDRLRENRYRFFIETLRSSMQGAGALRIDHVMGLMRLFWIPPGKTPREGAYVHYAVDEMLAIVALESQRNRCMVIGEDLGTVAESMRAALARTEVLSYRLLYFERDAQGGFKPPGEYPANALVAVSTHDLATLAGWWAGQDIQMRLRLGLFPQESLAAEQLLGRAQEKMLLLMALHQAGLLSIQDVAQAAGGPQLPPRAIEAVHAFLAATPSALLMVQLEDVLGVVEQANMPGTTEQHPNWQRKLPVDVAALGSVPLLRSLASRLSALRPRSTASIAPPQPARTRIPRATYRLQFHRGFGFDDAVRILPYLARLGISHVYCSPIQRARAGSMHGYDVVAPGEINPELGGPQGYARFTKALVQAGMGQLLDLVPNHMGVLGADNPWWTD